MNILIIILIILIVVLLLIENIQKEKFDNIDKCPKIITYFDSDIPGHNMYYFPQKDVTEEKCAEFCKDKGCHWYNYNSKSNKCWVKQGKAKNGHVTGFKIPGGTESECGKYHYYDNVDIPGHNSLKTPFIGITEDECQKKCDLHICDWYNYDKNKKKCWLKKKRSKGNVKTVINLI
jgi:hypothetical protein